MHANAIFTRFTEIYVWCGQIPYVMSESDREAPGLLIRIPWDMRRCSNNGVLKSG